MVIAYVKNRTSFEQSKYQFGGYVDAFFLWHFQLNGFGPERLQESGYHCVGIHSSFCGHVVHFKH